MINENLIQIRDFQGAGYKPLIDYRSWRVAVLRYIDELEPENLTFIEAHHETDEVFILVEGQCLLLLAETENMKITKWHSIEMEPHKLYNIKKDVYHSHILSKDAHLIIIENQDTSNDNSSKIFLQDDHKKEILSISKGFIK